MGDAAERKTSPRLSALEKQPNSPQNILQKGKGAFTRCAIALKQQFSNPSAGHPSMALARCASQTPRVYHLKELNRQQRSCSWIGNVFVARPDLPAEPVRRRRRMCC